MNYCEKFDKNLDNIDIYDDNGNLLSINSLTTMATLNHRTVVLKERHNSGSPDNSQDLNPEHNTTDSSSIRKRNRPFAAHRSTIDPSKFYSLFSSEQEHEVKNPLHTIPSENELGNDDTIDSLHSLPNIHEWTPIRKTKMNNQRLSMGFSKIPKETENHPIPENPESDRSDRLTKEDMTKIITDWRDQVQSISKTIETLETELQNMNTNPEKEEQIRKKIQHLSEATKTLKTLSNNL